MAQMRVTVNRLRNNMIIAKDVYTNTGIILIAEGTPVTKEVISLLTKHFIDSVIVDYMTAQNDFSLSPQEAPHSTTASIEKQF